MKKEIKKIGGAIGITFTAAERKVYGFDVGDVVDLSEMVVVGPHNYPSGFIREEVNDKRYPDVKMARYTPEVLEKWE